MSESVDSSRTWHHPLSASHGRWAMMGQSVDSSCMNLASPPVIVVWEVGCDE